MKLIDLLVQELPKRGGFISGAREVVQDADGEVKFFDSGNLCFEKNCKGSWSGKPRGEFYSIGKNNFTAQLSEDYKTAIITREQYEAALAAPHQPAWDGEGLPPVGIECEWLASGDHDWMRVKVLAYHEDEVWLQPLNGAQSFTVGNPDDFRTMRTEAERKREEASKIIESIFYTEGTGGNYLRGMGVYDAIAAGKIPGVKLEASHE